MTLNHSSLMRLRKELVSLPEVVSFHLHSGTGEDLEALQMSKVAAFLRDESGATAIEYCLIAAGISIGIVAAVNSIGTS